MACATCSCHTEYAHVAKEIIDQCGGGKEQAIPVLQEIQRRYGYLPEEVIKEVAHRSDFTEVQLFGIATFYSQFRFTPRGEFLIKVCTGTACHVAGAGVVVEAISDELKVKEGGTTEDGKFSLETVACLGCCSLAPVMMVNEQTVGALDPLQIKKVLSKF